MDVKIKKVNLEGSITAKPSKSYAHRYLLASMLSKKSNCVYNIDYSDDIIATLNCIYAYGKKIIKYNLDNKNEMGYVKFFDEEKFNINPTFDCNESGTTLRLLVPIVLQKYNEASFIGKDRLIERGINIYEDVFNNVIFNKSKFKIETIGKIIPSTYTFDGDVSSQYISGLLFALPLLDGDSEIIITKKLESKNYILITLDVLKNFNIDIDSKFYDDSEVVDNIYARFIIKGNQKYISKDVSIEGDYSNIAFIDAFNYFGNKINIDGLNENSYQSDKVYKKLFDELNEKSAVIDIANCIDLGPVLMAFAALKNGARFINTKRLRIKESDRGEVMAIELRKIGSEIDVLENEIIVKKRELKNDGLFDTHNDHRIAMALSILSINSDITLNGAECVNKSYPEYFNDLKKLGATIENLN